MGCSGHLAHEDGGAWLACLLVPRRVPARLPHPNCRGRGCVSSRNGGTFRLLGKFIFSHFILFFFFKSRKARESRVQSIERRGVGEIPGRGQWESDSERPRKWALLVPAPATDPAWGVWGRQVPLGTPSSSPPGKQEPSQASAAIPYLTVRRAGSPGS